MNSRDSRQKKKLTQESVINDIPLTQNCRRNCLRSKYPIHRSTVLKLLVLCLASIHSSQAQKIIENSKPNFNQRTPFHEHYSKSSQSQPKSSKTKDDHFVTGVKRPSSQRRSLYEDFQVSTDACEYGIHARYEPFVNLECQDTDDGAGGDSYGDKCEVYIYSWCGGYDTDTFFSNEMCCLCGGGYTNTAPTGDPSQCCEGTIQSTKSNFGFGFSYLLLEWCCDGFNYCENGYEIDCKTDQTCPFFDQNCARGQESDGNGECCDGRISTGLIARNDHDKCDNFSYCAPVYTDYQDENEIYLEDYIGSPEEWMPCPEFDQCLAEVQESAYTLYDFDDFYCIMTVTNESEDIVKLWVWIREQGEWYSYIELLAGQSYTTQAGESFVNYSLKITDKLDSDTPYAIDGLEIFFIWYESNNKSFTIRQEQGYNPGTMTPRNYRDECCSGYEEDANNCCVGYDYCRNNYRQDCDGTLCTEFDSCDRAGDGGAQYNEITGEACQQFNWCGIVSEYSQEDQEIVYTIAGRCCYGYDLCDEGTQPLDCYGNKCENYPFCDNGYESDYDGNFCNIYLPKKYREHAARDVHHDCDTYYNDEFCDTYCDLAEDGKELQYYGYLDSNPLNLSPNYEQFEDWRDFAYSEFFSNNNLADDSNCHYQHTSYIPTEYEDPCLLYYEEFSGDGSTGASCALCKYNAIRITTKLNTTSDKWSTICGYTDYDPDAEDALDLIRDKNPSIKCHIDPFYIDLLGDLWTAADDEREFYPTEKTYNSTTGNWEIFCLEPAISDDESCSDFSTVLQQSYVEQLQRSNVNSYQVYQQTIGCRICMSGYITRVRQLAEVGQKELYCDSAENYDSTQENVPCQAVGQIQMLEGYIEEEQTLECLQCDSQIPNCLICESTASCDICKVGFLQAKLKDAHGNTNTICIKDFCGLEGKGVTCSGTPNIPNCLKSTLNGFSGSSDSVEDCVTCQPGYNFEYSFYPQSVSNHVIRTCVKPQGELEYDIFIKPSEERQLTSAEEDDLYRQYEARDGGKTVNDAFYYLAQAFTRLGQATYPSKMSSWLKTNYQTILQASEADSNYTVEFDERNNTLEDLREEWWLYENVTVNIWLAKGHHHFIQCSEYLEYTSQDQLPLLCKSPYSILPVGKRAPASDNIKFYVRPLECQLRFSYFNTRQEGFNEIKFWNWCIDFTRGDPKPQIRIHDGRSMFNITNFAQFENIQFSAEDAMAKINSTYSGYAILDPIFQFVPLIKCNFTSEPTGHLEQAPAEMVTDILSNIIFNCSSGYNFTLDAPSMEAEQTCNPTTHTDSNAPNICEGEVWQADFWHKEMTFFSYAYQNWATCREYEQEQRTIEECEYTERYSGLSDLQYTKRHKTLFNLYSFDTFRSERTHSPTLNLIDCDFKYFFNQTSLIQVETNNFSELGINFQSDNRLLDTTFKNRVGEVWENDIEASMQFAIDETSIADRVVAYIGEDRGARISITNSTFKHSHFCKGMIVYKEQKTLEYEDYKLLVNFTVNNIRTENITDGRAEPFIRIIDSEFENIGYQQTVSDLSFSNLEVNIEDTTVASYFDPTFAKFNNRGSIINAQGFPGTIEIRDNVFKRNMAYIQDVLVEEANTDKDYMTPSTMRYSDFHQDGASYFRFKVCDKYSYEANYAFNSLFDPNGEVQDEDMNELYETYSPIFIQANKGPMMFIANNFTQNIGTIGGVINIQSPNFEQAMSDFEVKNSSSWTFKSCSSCDPITHAENGLNETLPMIIMKDNRFEKNMAYFAGNAFYISSTMRQTAIFDYLQFCGAGIMIESNLFENNIGLKRHNGGAGVIRCKRFTNVDLAVADYFLSNRKSSGLFLKERNATDAELIIWGADTQDDMNYTYFENPEESVMNVTDLFDFNSEGSYRTNYTVMKYGTHISNNTFHNNLSGKKGTALLVSQVSQLVIQSNVFEQNRPVTAIEEMKYSPYYEFFLNKSRTVTYLPVSVDTETCIEELSWYDKCQRESAWIDAPATQGALYVESCHFSTSCYTQIPEVILDQFNPNNATQVELLSELNETMTAEYDVITPWNRMTVSYNSFSKNIASALLSTTQLSYNQPQSSAVYIVGGIHANFFYNSFTSHVGGYGDQAIANSSDIYSYLPENYFEYSHAPVVRIEYPQMTQTLDIEDDHEMFFLGNLFKDNKNYQIVGYPDRYYYGSLLHFDCEIAKVKLKFEDNLVQYNLFIGPYSSLFYINGGLIEISRNTFSYNGLTSTTTITNHPLSLNRDAFSFPYEEYAIKLSQDAGVFLFDFYQYDMAQGNAHVIQENTFEHIYCSRGCAYAAKGTGVQQFWFNTNSYKYMVASSSGAVFDSAYLDLPDSNLFRDVWLQVYVKEKIEYTFGGAISVVSTNVPVTIIEDTDFRNNYGDNGAALSFDQGGGLYCIDCRFTMNQTSQQYEETYNRYEELFVVEASMSQILTGLNETEQEQFQEESERILEEKIPASQLLIQNYNGQRPMETFIDYLSLVEIVDSITNYDGQVKILRSRNEIKNSKTQIQAYNQTTLQVLIQEQFNINILNNTHSAFIQPQFEHCMGTRSSAISVGFSHLDLLANSTKKLVNFSDNVAFDGTTIYSQSSEMVFDQIYMTNNFGNEGGCLHFVSTEVTIIDSLFARNHANQGGVFFAIQKSVFNVQRSFFVQNLALDASVMYGLANIADNSLQFEDCTFSENYGKSNAIHMLLSSLNINNCTFTNNFAKYVTHGITLISSNLVISDTIIQFERNCYWTFNFREYRFMRICSEDADFFERLDLSKLDTGFFNLYLTSTALITDNTIIQNLLAQKQAVAYVIGQSSLAVSNNVRFLNNTSMSLTDTSTLHFSNAGTIDISEAYFQDNSQINIKLQSTNLMITNSSFTGGKKSLIHAFKAEVKIYGVHMYNSSDDVQGHGLYCLECHDVIIANSTFENLTASQGGAIFMINMEDSVNEIMNNTFYRNRAQFGGAISFDNPSRVYFFGNNFTENQAMKIDPTWKECNGGALEYSCRPLTEVNGNFLRQGDCEIVLRENLFDSNSALNKGGAARYLNKNFTFDTSLIYLDGQNGTGVRRILSEAEAEEDTNSYMNNTAIYGDIIGGYPASLYYNMSYNYDIVTTLGAIDNELQTNIIRMAPGQQILLSVNIYDLEGRLYVDEYDAVATIDFVKDQDELDIASVVSGREAIASNGVFTFSALQIRQTPNSTSLIEFVVQNLNVYGNDVSFDQEPPIFNVQARSCIEGERYSEDLQCVKCPVGYYLYIAQREQGTCLTCDLKANCHGQNFTSPRPGYWRSNETSLEYIKCLGDSCLGGDLEHPLGKCEEGYGGVLCADCIDGYHRKGNFECSECPSIGLNIFVGILFLCALIAALVLLVKSVTQGVDKIKPLYQVYLKIFLNHYQLLQIVGKILFDWPIQFEVLLNIQKFLIEIPVNVLSADCLVMQLFLGNNPTHRLNYLRGVSVFVLPFVIVIASISFWTIYGCITKMKTEEKLDKNMATISVVFFVFYTTIVFQMTELVNCMRIEDKMRLYNDLEEICLEGDHVYVTVFIAVPGLILWAIGIPLFFLRRLRLRREEIIEARKTIENERNDYLDYRFRMQLGFLTSGYRDEYYYWEIVLLLRKTVLVILMTFLQSVSGGVQSLTFLAIMIIFYLIQQRVNPYYDSKLNNLEKISLFVLIMTIYAGLYFQAGKGDQIIQNVVIKWTIFLVVFIPSCIFLVTFIDRLRMEILKKIASKSKLLFKIISFGRLNLRQFISEHQYDEDDSLEDFDNFQNKPDQVRRMLSKRSILVELDQERRRTLKTILKEDVWNVHTQPDLSSIGYHSQSILVDHREINLQVVEEMKSEDDLKEQIKRMSEALYHNASHDITGREDLDESEQVVGDIHDAAKLKLNDYIDRSIVLNATNQYKDYEIEKGANDSVEAIAASDPSEQDSMELKFKVDFSSMKAKTAQMKKKFKKTRKRKKKKQQNLSILDKEKTEHFDSVQNANSIQAGALNLSMNLESDVVLSSDRMDQVTESIMLMEHTNPQIDKLKSILQSNSNNVLQGRDKCTSESRIDTIPNRIEDNSFLEMSVLNNFAKDKEKADSQQSKVLSSMNMQSEFFLSSDRMEMVESESDNEPQRKF